MSPPVQPGRSRKSTAAITLIALAAALAITAALFLWLIGRHHYGTVVSPSGSCTLTATTTASGGTMTVCAQYSISPAGHLRLRSVLASYRAPNGYQLPHFTVTLADGATGIQDGRLSGPLDESNEAQFYQTRFTAFPGKLSAPQTMVVTLMAENAGTNEPISLASVALELSRRAFPCPEPGFGSSGNSKSVPVC